MKKDDAYRFPDGKFHHHYKFDSESKIQGKIPNDRQPTLNWRFGISIVGLLKSCYSNEIFKQQIAIMYI